MNKHMLNIIGLGAFIIGGVMARQTAIEGIELTEEKINDFVHRNQPKPPPKELTAE